MNKEEWLWVSIRIFGVFLLVLAIISLPDAISAFYTVNAYSKIPTNINIENGNKMYELYESMFISGRAQGYKAIAQLIIYLSFSIYFIRGGKFLHGLLCK